MHIESISLQNFRCFGSVPEKVTLEPGTNGFVGDNGSGKSSTLEALKRLFSPVPAERLLKKADIHFGPGEDGQSVTEREVFIDVVFDLGDGAAVPYVFNDVFFDGADSRLKSRLRLEGRYVRSEAFADDIDVKIYSIRTLGDVPFGPEDERKSPVRGRALQFAELIYIPAHRDSLGVTRHALKNVLTRLERSADWDEATRQKSQDFAKQMETNLNQSKSVEMVTEDLTDYWQLLHSGHYDSDPTLSVVATEFEQLLRDLTLRFTKSPGGGQRQLEELSEGQVSLLYFALSATLHGIVRKMEAASPEPLKGFKPLDFTPPPLTLFALEEPENHLAPFYLPRLMALLQDIHGQGGSQAFVTSHSTSILNRIAPRKVRYYRHCSVKLVTTVKPLPLPEEDTEADKFIAQVILAHPEIYFSKLVIVGEGDSERLIIPRVADAFGISLDPTFVAFVPIGGRHAQHLWTLLNGLQIPHLTLLDFDLGRHNAGMGRLKNTVAWLQEAGHQLGEVQVPANAQVDADTVSKWLQWAQGWNVFYSYPLDLDLMMIQSFPAAYSTARAFDADKDDPKKIAVSVFGDQGKGNDELAALGVEVSTSVLYTYKSLFKSSSKPGSHLQALGNLTDLQIVTHCPGPIRELIRSAASLLELEVNVDGPFAQVDTVGGDVE